MNTLLYRIETADGKGICTTVQQHDNPKSKSVCSLYQAKCPHQEHEHSVFSAKDEPKACYLTCQKHWQYAFPTIKALEEWFPNAEGRKIMQAAGASVIEYTTQGEVMSNGYQALFDKQRAFQTGKHFNLETLEEMK